MADNTLNPLQAIPLSKDITEVDNEFLMKEVTNEEILKVVKQINPLKASDPDGIRSIFYPKNWDVVGKSVCNIVRSFLS